MLISNINKYILTGIILLIIIIIILVSLNLYQKRKTKYNYQVPCLTKKSENYEVDEVNFINDNNVIVKVPINNKFSDKFKTRVSDEIIFRKISAYLLNNIIKSNIIDLGAWIGDNSLPWAKLTKSKIYAIDPSENNISYINNLIKLNDVKNISTIKKAISDKIEIIGTDDDIDHCSFTKGSKYKLESDTLDNLYKNKIIDNIGYIHLDVEGFEFKVIKGSINIIDKFKPIIAFEQHLNTDNYKELCSYLKNKNYDVYLIDEILPSNKKDSRNFIAFPKDILKNNLVQNINKHINSDSILKKQ